ncbi:MAG: hypothetical protein M0R47_20425 [Methylobacter sp.]|uniref:hypothetical protein n=1 Tax=Methylobacter sp. TaxID=2051955 RepID=UPI0025CD2259|nr:hypothetical protein [Methylobacter sp.]MCK9622888.1 hypothetical protein [Methylobacter sp.]
MAKQFYIKLQSPFIEMPVEAEDASGKVSSLLVGFKRYPTKEVEVKLNSFKDLTEDQYVEYLKNEILYIKNAVLEVYDGGVYVEDLVIEDTRTAKPNEFFQEADNVLVVLLEYYLSSAPWKNSLFSAFIKSLYNVSFKEAELKN